MKNTSDEHRLMQTIATEIKKIDKDIKFTMIEVGCLDLHKEPFYKLLDFFPGSKLIGFEAEASDCERMNSKARDGVRYYPVLLGGENEKRQFYITSHQMCCSLYEPNYELNKLYHNFQFADLKNVTQVETITMDKFIFDNNIGPVDFIKIDVQGAELEIFKGGIEVLKDVLFMISEVMFIPHYKEQPLFGEISEFLDRRGLMFHKFLNIGGRALKPFMFNNDPNYPSQHIWSDAIFISHVNRITNLTNQEILKLSLIACIYGSYDISFYCFSIYDKKNNANLLKKIVKSFKESH